MRLCALVPALLLALVGALLLPASGHAAARLDIGIQDPLEPVFEEQDPQAAYDTIRNQGIRVVRLPIAWTSIASTKPNRPRDPKDPAYAWGPVDERLEEMWARGLTPMLVLYAPPTWTRPKDKQGNLRRSAAPGDFADFAYAAALRYSGKSGQLPRVRLWQLWNEPNLKLFLEDTPEHYRKMVNAAYPAVHKVHRDNVVIGAGISPFSDPRNEFGIPPMEFVRRMLCVTSGSRPRPTCKARVRLDVWANHPYTGGGPSHKAPGDQISLGNLPRVRSMLDAARRAGRIRSRGRLRFWITEFSWDTSPPDPGGVPLDRHARWVAEALYRMWRLDIDLLVWFQLRDAPAVGGNWGGTFQAGLFEGGGTRYIDATPKPFAQVLRFPFVAIPAGGGRATVWGRTPGSRRQRVTIERRSGDEWKRVARVGAGSGGIFKTSPRVPRGSLLRARVDTDTSLPYQNAPNRDIRVNAFGGPLRR